MDFSKQPVQPRAILRRRVAGAVAGLALASLVWVIGAPVLERTSLFTDDWLGRMFPARPDAAGIVIVEIDEETAETYGGLPLPRELVARLLNAVAAGEPKAVFVDMLFRDERRGGDADLVAALAGLGERAVVAVGAALSVAAPVSGRIDPAGTGPLIPIFRTDAVYAPAPSLVPPGTRRGLVTLVMDADGVVRRVPCAARGVDGVLLWAAFQCAAITEGRERADALLASAVGSSGSMTLRYPGRWTASPWEHFSAATVLEALDSSSGAQDLRDSLGGKAVFIGSTATGAGDLFRTPSDPAAPGVWIHATAYNQLITGQIVSRVPFAVGLAVLLLLLVLIALAASGATRAIPWAMISVVQLIVLWVVGAGLFAWDGLLLPLVPLTLAIVGQGAGDTVARALTTYAERTRISAALSRYVSPEMLEYVLHNPTVLETGMTRREMTILFCDLKGFTTLSNTLAPDEVMAMLQEYLAEMTSIVFSWGGSIDKIMGDGILARFGAPRPLESHAERGVRAAIGMQQAMGRLGGLWEERGLPRLQMRVGVNTAQVLVGNIGTREHIEYTVIGSGVNLASRLESAAPAGGVLCGEGTFVVVRDLVEGEKTSVTAKGFEGTVVAYLVTGMRPGALSPALSVDTGGP